MELQSYIAKRMRGKFEMAKKRIEEAQFNVSSLLKEGHRKAVYVGKRTQGFVLISAWGKLAGDEITK